MATSSGDETLLHPARTRRATTSRDGRTGLPADLLEQSASRLRALALLYAFIFIMAAYFPALFFPEDRAGLYGSIFMWGPGAIAITVALVVAALIHTSRVSRGAIPTLGLVFEVVSSYGIATSEFLHPGHFSSSSPSIGLSWVAVWTLLFTVAVPTKPRHAVVAALASVSAVPVVVAVSLRVFPGGFQPTATMFFFGLVFPYFLVVMMAYVGARVVYSLGTEVRRARELGSYRLVERLGAGGMGEVWRAEHRLLARPAAVKLIRPPEDDAAPVVLDETRQRFEREARAIAQLRSPHTVELFDFGVASDGAFYIVMELLDGFDTDALVRRFGPLSAARVIHVLRQMCHSLSEAESLGLVHRDIKPANVFLCRYGEDCDFVKVLDFGIVKATGDAAETQMMLTQDAAIRGTPAFMAPEQALGGADIDGRVDIYATGCVGYWLLTGQHVFTGETPMALLLKHVHDTPEAPSLRTELPIPPALDAVILSCLAKDPKDRPQTAKELSRRLAEINPGTGWTEDEARAWWAEHAPNEPLYSAARFND
jgi:serine/threonine-protein kinase